MLEKKVKWHLRVFIDVDGYHEEVGIFGYYSMTNVAKAIGVSKDFLYDHIGEKIIFKKFDSEEKYVFFVLMKN